MPYNEFMFNKTFMYEIQCPYAPEENEVTLDIDRAMGICFDLAEEFGYACVRDAFGNLYGDYGNVIQAVEDGVIWLYPFFMESGWPRVPVDKLNFFTTNSLHLISCQPLAMYN